MSNETPSIPASRCCYSHSESSQPEPLSRRILRCLLILTCAIAAVPAELLRSAEEPIIVRVEEDWQIEIGAPDPQNDAPQLVNVISPVANTHNSHGVFEINHATLPDYTSGGIQIQTWIGDTHLGYKSAPKSQKLTTDNETITYTISMKIADNAITYEVSNGQSQTWGTFGNPGDLKLTSPTTLTNLNTYTPAMSIKHSRVGFAKRRVKSFVLQEVRYHTQSGEIITDTTDRAVHSYMPQP